MKNRNIIFLILFILLIINIFLSIINLIRVKGVKRDILYISESNDISGRFVGNTSSILINGSYVEWTKNGTTIDTGKYVPNLNAIFFVNIGKMDVNTTSNSIILSRSYKRYLSSSEDINNCNNNFSNCITNYDTDVNACQVPCDSISCMNNCTNSMRQDYINCLSDIENCCANALGDLDKNYNCSFRNTLNSGNAYGFWKSPDNQDESLRILSNDNSVLYFSKLGGGQGYYGTYNGKNIVINDYSGSVLDTYEVTYDMTGDMLILSQSFSPTNM